MSEEIKIGDLVQEPVLNASKIIFENSSGFTKRDTAFGIAALSNGSTVELLASPADLPPLLHNFIQLEPTRSYRFTEPFAIPTTILIPAGYVGFIEAEFQQIDGMDFTGTGPMFATLNIDGIINSIVAAGAGAITVTTDANHGLLDGQFVNITGTSNYDQQRLVVSNASGSVFDVQIEFVINEGGFFDTGYEALTIDEIDLTNAFANDLFDLTAANSISAVFAGDRFTAFGFLSPGIIRGRTIAIDFVLLPFIVDGLIIENATTLIMTQVLIPSLDVTSTAKGLTLTGASTGRVIIDGVVFDLADVDQRAIRIDPSITSASIDIMDSPDNEVASAYFDTSGGGLDETDPQVNATDNGVRKDSHTIAEARTNGILEVDGSGEIPVPVVDIVSAAGDWIQDSTTERLSIDITTGLITFNGLKPVIAMIKYDISAAQASGSAQTIDFTLQINGVPQTKSMRTVVTAGTGTFIQVVYNGGNFDINPGDTIQLFKDNISNANNTEVQNGVILFNVD